MSRWQKQWDPGAVAVDDHTVGESVKGASEEKMDKATPDVDEQDSGWRENKVTLNLDCYDIDVFLNS